MGKLPASMILSTNFTPDFIDLTKCSRFGKDTAPSAAMVAVNLRKICRGLGIIHFYSGEQTTDLMTKT